MAKPSRDDDVDLDDVKCDEEILSAFGDGKE